MPSNKTGSASQSGNQCCIGHAVDACMIFSSLNLFSKLAICTVYSVYTSLASSVHISIFLSLLNGKSVVNKTVEGCIMSALDVVHCQTAGAGHDGAGSMHMHCSPASSLWSLPHPNALPGL